MRWIIEAKARRSVLLEHLPASLRLPHKPGYRCAVTARRKKKYEFESDATLVGKAWAPYGRGGLPRESRSQSAKGEPGLSAI
jgi:hypothetical protein